MWVGPKRARTILYFTSACSWFRMSTVDSDEIGFLHTGVGGVPSESIWQPVVSAWPKRTMFKRVQAVVLSEKCQKIGLANGMHRARRPTTLPWAGGASKSCPRRLPQRVVQIFEEFQGR